MKHAYCQSPWWWLWIPHKDVESNPTFHIPQRCQFETSHKSVCVRQLKFQTSHGCVYASFLKYRGCKMGINIILSEEISNLQDDTNSLSTSDAPYLMRFSGNLIVSSFSTQVTIRDSTQGCDFHAHFPHSPRVVNWNSKQGCVSSTPFKIPHKQLMCCV